MIRACGEGWEGMKGQCIRERIKKPKNIARAAVAVAGVGAVLKARAKLKTMTPIQKAATAIGVGAVVGGAALAGYKLKKRSKRIKKAKAKRKASSEKLKTVLSRKREERMVKQGRRKESLRTAFQESSKKKGKF
jgi:hypothetical protein